MSHFFTPLAEMVIHLGKKSLFLKETLFPGARIVVPVLCVQTVRDRSVSAAIFVLGLNESLSTYG